MKPKTLAKSKSTRRTMVLNDLHITKTIKLSLDDGLINKRTKSNRYTNGIELLH